MRRYYPAIIDRNKNAAPSADGEIGGVYGVTFPDVPGCYGAGDTLEAAINNARAALEAHLSVMTDEGMEWPVARSLEGISADPDLDVAAIAMVDVLLPGKPTRVNISMDSNLLEEIDAASSNRSAFLAEGARALLGRSAATGQFSIVNQSRGRAGAISNKRHGGRRPDPLDEELKDMITKKGA